MSLSLSLSLSGLPESQYLLFDANAITATSVFFKKKKVNIQAASSSSGKGRKGGEGGLEGGEKTESKNKRGGRRGKKNQENRKESTDTLKGKTLTPASIPNSNPNPNPGPNSKESADGLKRKIEEKEVKKDNKGLAIHPKKMERARKATPLMPLK
jgi:hypothetical protein